MLRYIFITTILFSFSLQIFGQNKPSIVVSENISQQNYRQDNGKLFCDSINGFIVRWEDYRYGTSTYFAQKFDKNLLKVNNKFTIRDYYLISYSTNNKLFGLYRKTYSYSSPDWDGNGVQYFGEYFNQDQVVSEAVYLGGGEYPWCGTGWPGEGSSISRFNDEILTASDFGGYYIVKKIDVSGKDTLLIPQDPQDYEIGYNVSTAYNNKGESMIAYYGIDYNDDTAGIWIRSYSVENKLIAEKQINKLTGDLYNWGMRLNLVAASVSDSLFQLLYIDSLKLKSIIANVHGSIIKENGYQILYRNEYPENSFYEDNLISPSNFNNGNRAVILQLQEYPNMLSNSLYYFNQNGDLVSTPIFDSTFTYKLNSQVFKDEDDNLVSATKISNKIYLLKLNDFNIIDSMLISKESANSNELKTRITKYKENQFFVSYRNEVKTSGRFVSKDGNPISEEKKIDSQSLKFFSDGSALRTWSKKEENYKATKGFSILDSEFNTVKSDTLVLNYDNYYGFCSATISSDDNFIIVYQNMSGVFTAKYDKQGNEIKTVKLSEDNRSSVGARVFFDGSKTFVYWHNYIYSFDEDFILESVSEKFVYRIFAYLGNDEFAASQYNYQEKRSSYSIFNSNGDTLLTDITTIYREIDDPMVMSYAKNDEFIVFYLEENKLFANTYNSNGETIVDKFVVHDTENEVVRDITFSVNGNKIMFGWSGKQNGEYDFDAYCVSYDIDLLTDIQKSKLSNVITEYKLEQNYPNPFNPSTTIKYGIANVASSFSSSILIILKVFDILGREVSTLVNKEQKPGNYQVTFDASNLSSGVYYYQIKTGSFAKTRKMILIK